MVNSSFNIKAISFIELHLLAIENYRKERTANSTCPKGGVPSPLDSFVVIQTLVFQIKFCGKSPALRVAAKR